MGFVPSYHKLIGKELARRAETLMAALSCCTICPHNCRVNRLKGERGFCRTGARAIVASFGPHFGEEPELVGWGGSGTIFFSFCNLRCVFCQNCELSYYGEGEEVTEEELARIMLSLQERGCHNINLVSPSHVVPQIVAALKIAADRGLNLPLVYNSGGYDKVETLQLLEGIVDIYMPDIKFGSNEMAEKYSGIKGYFDIVKAAVKEMHRQVGILETDENGIARQGLIIRHLVLPEDLSRTQEVMNFIAQEISPATYVNIMAQYFPAHFARKFPELSRRITRKEFLQALEAAKKAGLTNTDRSG